MNKKLIIGVGLPLIAGVIGLMGVPAHHAAGNKAAITIDQPATNQQPAATSPDQTTTGSLSTGGTDTTNPASGGTSTDSAAQVSNPASSPNLNTQSYLPAAPTPTITSKSLAFIQNPTRPDLLDGYCTYNYSDGSTNTFYVGSKPAVEGSVKVQLEC